MSDESERVGSSEQVVVYMTTGSVVGDPLVPPPWGFWWLKETHVVHNGIGIIAVWERKLDRESCLRMIDSAFQIGEGEPSESDH